MHDREAVKTVCWLIFQTLFVPIVSSALMCSSAFLPMCSVLTVQVIDDGRPVLMTEIVPLFKKSVDKGTLQLSLEFHQII